MNRNDAILELAKKNNGVLLTKQVTKPGFSRSTLKELVDTDKISLIQRCLCYRRWVC